MTPRTIAIIGYDGCTALDLTAAAETFHTAAYLSKCSPYQVITASLDGGVFSTGSGLRVLPGCSLDSIGPIDTLILPGGGGLRNPTTGTPIADWIRTNEPRIRRIASVCTGLFGLAATGLLEGRRAATHWRFASLLESQFPGIEVDADAIFVRDGKYYSSAGVTAGIDLALALIEEDLGATTALSVAREMVVYMKRPGGQQQFSDQLRFQTTSAPKIRELVAFVHNHLEEDLGVERLADEARLSPRHFARLFRESLGMPPGEFVERARLGEAVARLAETEVPIDVVATGIGYRSADAFSRAFRRKFGITPSEYRDRFSSPREFIVARC